MSDFSGLEQLRQDHPGTVLELTVAHGDQDTDHYVAAVTLYAVGEHPEKRGAMVGTGSGHAATLDEAIAAAVADWHLAGKSEVTG